MTQEQTLCKWIARCMVDSVLKQLHENKIATNATKNSKVNRKTKRRSSDNANGSGGNGNHLHHDSVALTSEEISQSLNS